MIAISFRDYGYKFIPSWTESFQKEFQRNRGGRGSAPNVIKVSITERWSLYALQSVLTTIMKRNTPVQEHENTLLYFGSDVDEFCDQLRMHNLMTCYVFLIDEFGRVRFAGSGEASADESRRVVGFAKELSSVERSTDSATRRGRKRASKRRQ